MFKNYSKKTKISKLSKKKQTMRLYNRIRFYFSENGKAISKEEFDNLPLSVVSEISIKQFKKVKGVGAITLEELQMLAKKIKVKLKE